MADPDGGSFLYLDREGRWPDFRWQGLELAAGGALRLRPLPLLAPDGAAAGAAAGGGTVAARLAALPAPDGPAGVAVDGDGAVYWSDPDASRLWRIDPCDGRRAPLPCVGAGTAGATELRAPRGLLWHAGRRALVAADSGNHRLVLLAPGSGRLLEVWGQPEPAGAPQPSSAPGRFDTPTGLAGDRDGAVYVVDAGNRRVQKLDARGQVDAAFWARAGAAGLARPSDVAVGERGGATAVFVVDSGLPGGGARIAVLDASGRPLGGFALPPAWQPLGLAWAGGDLFVGDNAGRTLWTVGPDGAPVGEALGFSGPVAALAAPAAPAALAALAALAPLAPLAALAPDTRGDLWLLPGGGLGPLRLDLAGACVRSGVLWGGPFGAGTQPILWQRLRALGQPLPAGAHLQLFFHAGQPGDTPPVPDPAAAEPFAAPAWTALPADALDGLVRGSPAPRLWVGAHLGGEGRQSPRLEQLRIDFDQEGYARHLPAIYRGRLPAPAAGEAADGTLPPDVELLERFLALFESLFADVEDEIGGLTRRIDAWAAPPSWLPWLAGWLGVDLDETWPEEKQRRAVAGAFAAAGRRGTAAGLREAIAFATGIAVHVEEPVHSASWWSLPAAGALASSSGALASSDGALASSDGPSLGPVSSLLGVTTRLAPTQPEGAVVGTTAILGGSHLAGEDGPGAFLYQELADQFAVQVYERQVAAPGQLSRLQAVIDRERPAHTTCHLCIIRPSLRIGMQARLGIDTVVAGPAPPSRLGAAGGVVLGGEAPGRLGAGTRVGRGTRLGAAALRPGRRAPRARPHLLREEET